ncbi:MAG: hypothetical protein JJ896_09260 [Rhodothermales bacterium]|nr:hypothetical protein [Rhodothermales bacterium]MBO6779825.1 hypothetical protein [Rhodothermales bacterium]
MRLRITASLFALTVLLSGCRMYGGYGSEEAAYAQIQEALERYEARADRLQSDLTALTAAAADEARLASAVVKLTAVVSAQEAALVFHRAKAAEVSENSSYREVSRALGAMLSEQQVVQDQYAQVVADIVNNPGLDRQDPSRYSIVPAALAAVEASLLDISVLDALQSR